MKVFLTHHDAVFADYLGERALAALETHAVVVRNRTGSVLSGAELAAAAAGCEAIIAHRATPGDPSTFEAAPDLLAFLRCAVDVSTIDIAAASRAGVLVTRATPGGRDDALQAATRSVQRPPDEGRWTVAGPRRASPCSAGVLSTPPRRPRQRATVPARWRALRCSACPDLIP